MFEGWLHILPGSIPETAVSPLDIAREELSVVFPDRSFDFREDASLGEGYSFCPSPEGGVFQGGRTGLLYGAYELIRRCGGTDLPFQPFSSSPRYALRMLNCWDNADGSVERGYSGRSLFFEDNRLNYDPSRIRQLARLLASVGLNVIVVRQIL